MSGHNGSVVVVHDAMPVCELATMESCVPKVGSDLKPSESATGAAMAAVQRHAHRLADLLSAHRAQWQGCELRICRSNVFWLWPGNRQAGSGALVQHRDSDPRTGDSASLYVNLYGGDFEGGAFETEHEIYPVRRGTLIAAHLGELTHGPQPVLRGERLYFGLFIEPSSTPGRRHPGVQTLRWPFPDCSPGGSGT